MITFKNKKVLLVGLGRLGGGVATGKWLLQQRPKVLTITDLLPAKELQESLQHLGIGNEATRAKNNVRLVLGRHRKKDFKTHDIVVVNPAVSYKNPLLSIARKAGKHVVNEATIFAKRCPAPFIAVTGTRGKTTTVHWIHHLLAKRGKGKGVRGNAVMGGNSPEDPLLKILPRIKKNSPVVVEISSFQLEYFNKTLDSKFQIPNSRSRGIPHVAVITNLYVDHLNRYKTMEEYALMKARIFHYQTENDFLILHADNAWTKLFLARHPKSRTYFFSTKPLAKTKNGIFVDQENKKSFAFFQQERSIKKLFPLDAFEKQWGAHNVLNLLASSLAVHLYGIQWSTIHKGIATVPPVAFRQQVIHQDSRLTIVNDSAATIPEATIVALEQLCLPRGADVVRVSPRKVRKGQRLILITGGTDKNLEFAELAKTIKRTLSPSQVIFLEGSATEKLLQKLRRVNFFGKENPQIYAALEECVGKAISDKLQAENLNVVRESQRKVRESPRLILFSPGAASFEKFKNEYDRGETFNALIKKMRRSF